MTWQDVARQFAEWCLYPVLRSRRPPVKRNKKYGYGRG